MSIWALWNSNFYMSDKAFELLCIIMDIWLPDLKYFDEKCSRRLSKIPRYFEVVSSFILKMYQNNENFVIRHLILPNHVNCCSIPILRWIHKHIPEAPLNIMTQYHPDMNTNPNNVLYNEKYSDLSRKLNKEEIDKVFEIADSLNIQYKNLLY